MRIENSSDGFKEADEVADGMIPDSQIVNMINQITLAQDARASSAEATASCKTDNAAKMDGCGESKSNPDSTPVDCSTC